MAATKLQWKIGGEAGFGIMTAGLVFSKSFTRAGYHAFGYTEYPSLIRGGHNTYQAAISAGSIGAPIKAVHVLVALNREAIDLHKAELSQGAAVIYDSEKMQAEQDEFGRETIPVPVPFSKIAKEVAGLELMSNNVALGASIAVLGHDIELLLGAINDQFKGKGGEIITKNLSAAKAGYDYVKKNFPEPFKHSLEKPNKPETKLLITGNEAIGAGAIAAGCKFYSGYPMTPTSNILHFMAANERKYGMVVKQAEDEISVINMAIGAGFAGARAMVATSGGGFCLMTEGYGLAGMTETPVVIVMGQRGGPSTGLPTWTEQADLKFVLNAAHGEFPRIVVAPGDMEELFYWTMKAFNLAEKYQTPVIVITDKHLCESHASVDRLDAKAVKIERGEMVEEQAANYKRYAITETGVSPRALPGQPGNIFVANSDEHDETGLSTEDAHMRKAMMDKRMRKLQYAAKDIGAEGAKVYGPKRADITLIGWGSTKGAILDSIEALAEQGIKANFLHIIAASPFPTEAVSKALRARKPKLMIENNYSGQMAAVIREKTGIEIRHKLLKYDGRPIYPEEIAEEVKKVLKE
ncbi:2-oxoacid:acceptor oxidoreductase subunit alpha [Candidatus Woesearchaeota archaeon]|nr:2-oxoacid:acceptor oxidoreductase subunit alpha [Candidatus Woesearchaeota archaeon]